VGLDDEAVVDLADALKVNSSVLLLDLSHNAVEDIGARALARLLQERSCGSNRLRVLCLQHNQIGGVAGARVAGASIDDCICFRPARAPAGLACCHQLCSMTTMHVVGSLQVQV
jgi:hypothetical protein